MNLPRDLDQLIEQTPFGRVTIDIHRAYGDTVDVKARPRSQVKTEDVEAVSRTIGHSLGEMVLRGATGRLEVSITMDRGRLKFTYIEPITE